MRYRNTKRVTQPCRITVSSAGVVSFYAPYNEQFLEEFKNVFHKDNRHWNGDRKIWQIKQEGIAALVEILQKYYNQVEGLDALIESPFDLLKITPDAPLKLVRMAAKTLRETYHPDQIASEADAERLFPGLSEEFPDDVVGVARLQATAYLQEVGEAEKLILEIKASEEGE